MDEAPGRPFNVSVPLSYADLESFGELGRLFPKHQPLELEIGCGRGDFLLAYAARRPDANFLGVERKLVVARRAASKLARAGLENVRIVHGEIQYLVARYLPVGSFQAIHCYFPDPWPKKRHAKRRLFNPKTAEHFASLLAPKGVVHVRTDVPSYFDMMCDVFENSGQFKRVEVPQSLLECPTGFERRFVAEGKPIYRASFQLMTC